MQHDEAEQSPTAYVLDALPEPERREMEEHLRDCAKCRRESAGLYRAATALPLALAAEEPPRDLRKRILRAAHQQPAAALFPIALGLGEWGVAERQQLHRSVHTARNAAGHRATSVLYSARLARAGLRPRRHARLGRARPRRAEGTAPLVVIALAAGLAVAFVVAASALILALRLRRELRAVHRASAALGSAGLAGLDQVLREQDLQLRQVGMRASDLDRRLAGAEERLAQAIRRVGIVRFNPFRGTGGDQSFVVALLSEEGSGVVVTGLHNRTDTRVYAKPVEHGASRYPLSDEETEAIRVALGASRDGVGV